MASKHKEVFISYSTKDTDTAFALLNTLESYGLDCWIAPRNIPQGAQWAEEIDKAIQNARVFVVIVSTHSVESRQVPKEIALAVTACESIFPFRIDNIGLQGTFRYYLSDYQFTDATTDTKQKMKELAEVICSSLGKPIPEMKEDPEAPQTESPAPVSGTPAKEKAKEETRSLKETIERSKKPAAGTRSMKPVLIGVIAAVAVIAVILGVVLSGKAKKANTQAASAAQTQQAAAAAPAAEIKEEPKEATNGSSQADEAVSASAAEASAAEQTASDEAGQTADSASDEAGQTAGSVSAASAQQTGSSEAVSGDENKNQVGLLRMNDPDFGIWKRIAYEDKGAETKLNTSNLYIMNDGKIYLSIEDWLSAKNTGAATAITPEQLAGDTDKYILTAEVSLEDSFDGSISNKSTGFEPLSYSTYVPNISYGTPAPDVNPTSLSYDDIYPEKYCFIHFTGTYQESPVKKSDVDTWLVYEKQYPILSSGTLASLDGDWIDDMGNLWSFRYEEEALAFTLTDSAGTVYTGKSVDTAKADPDKENFFERIRFHFEEYSTDSYAVVMFDGTTLQLLDGNWDEYVLTRQG